MSKKKLYYITEVLTTTTQTDYSIEATSREDALKRYKNDGQYLGDCAGSGPDRVEVCDEKEIKE